MVIPAPLHHTHYVVLGILATVEETGNIASPVAPTSPFLGCLQTLEKNLWVPSVS